MKPLAVCRPPTITPRPHKGKQQTRRSTLTASRPLNRAQQAERQREQPDRTRKPSDHQLFKLYTGFIRPCLEYCSHIWGSSPYTSLLDRVESKAIHLISDPSLTSTLDPLSLRRKVASLSLFYRYYFDHCSDELAACIPPPMARPRSTRQATFAHNYSVELSNARINRFSDGFFPSTSHLWNSLPSAVFPASFKRQVYRHLRDQMA